MGKMYQVPRIEDVKIDQGIVMMSPSEPPGGSEPGDGKPPWTGNPDDPDHPSNKPKNTMFQRALDQSDPFGGNSVF